MSALLPGGPMGAIAPPSDLLHGLALRPPVARWDGARYRGSALESVSLVTWFDEDTTAQLLAELKPQVYVKGGDYDMRQLAETALVQGWGGRALAIPFVDGYSTTALVQRIRNS